MKTFVGIAILLAAASMAGAQDEGRVIKEGKVVRMRARPGDKVHAGPNALLLRPSDGKPVRELVLRDPARTVVPVLHQRRKGEVALYWLVFGGERTARAELGDDPEPVVVEDDFGRVRDPRRVTYRLRSEGERTIEREFTSEALIAYTRHDSAVTIRGIRRDERGRRTMRAFNEKREKIGEGPAGGVSVREVRFRPDPVRTNTPSAVTIRFENHAGSRVSVIYWATVNPADGTFEPGGMKTVVGAADLPEGASGVELRRKVVPKREGTVQVEVGFQIVGGKSGSVRAPREAVMGPARNAVVGYSEEEVASASGVGRTPGGESFEVPGRVLGGGKTILSDLGRAAPWGSLGTIAAPLIVEWTARDKEGRETQRWSAYTVAQGPGLEEAVRTGISSLTWTPAPDLAEARLGQDDNRKRCACRWVPTTKVKPIDKFHETWYREKVVGKSHAQGPHHFGVARTSGDASGALIFIRSKPREEISKASGYLIFGVTHAKRCKACTSTITIRGDISVEAFARSHKGGNGFAKARAFVQSQVTGDLTLKAKAGAISDESAEVVESFDFGLEAEGGVGEKGPTLKRKVGGRIGTQITTKTTGPAYQPDADAGAVTLQKDSVQIVWKAKGYSLAAYNMGSGLDFGIGIGIENTAEGVYLSNGAITIEARCGCSCGANKWGPFTDTVKLSVSHRVKKEDGLPNRQALKEISERDSFHFLDYYREGE